MRNIHGRRHTIGDTIYKDGSKIKIDESERARRDEDE
jgi:hypothetical protein